MNSSNPAIFHSSAKSVILTAGPLGIALGVSACLIQDSLKTDVRALAFGVVAGIITVVVLSLLACRFYTIELSESGIRAYSFWGRRRFIRWSEIETIRPFSLINLRYLRLYGSPPSKPLWMAIFIPNLSAFKEMVTKFAPKDSPILTFL